MEKQKTDLDILNEFLIRVANTNNVGIRRKIVVIKRFLSTLTRKKIMTDKRTDLIPEFNSIPVTGKPRKLKATWTITKEDIDNDYENMKNFREQQNRNQQSVYEYDGEYNTPEYWMMITPDRIGQKSNEPVDDELTQAVQKLYDMTTTDDRYRYRGIHTTNCGQFSDNCDHFLPNGMITNSLCVYYIRYYRPYIPQKELDKIEMLRKLYLEK